MCIFQNLKLTVFNNKKVELFHLDKVGQAGLLLAGDQLLQLLWVLLIHPSGQDDQKCGLIKHYYFSYTLVVKMIKSWVLEDIPLRDIMIKIQKYVL